MVRMAPMPTRPTITRAVHKQQMPCDCVPPVARIVSNRSMYCSCWLEVRFRCGSRSRPRVKLRTPESYAL
jgi:hypothetical protein